jgi:uncharacterized protein (TIGR00290 family)
MSACRALVLWTGGKDCNLALYEARTVGFEIAGLLTFGPEQPSFRAHPLAVMRAQAEALDLHHELAVVREPYEAGYREAIARACDAAHASALVTGDIDAVDGQPNWVRRCCEGSGIDVVTPLWGRPRKALLQQLIEFGFEVVLSCVRPPLDQAWLGHRLDAAVIVDLMRLHEEAGVDESGEQGEYHTLVLDGPGFEKRLLLQTSGARTADGLSFLEIEGVELIPRSG